MATYPEITTLAAWAAVINDPTDNEDANKLAQVDLQTRKFVDTMFNLILDSSTNKLKASVVGDASIVGLIKGSTSNTGTQQGLLQGTVSTPDFRDLAVSTAKLADNAVTTAKIADLQVTTAQLADVSVTAGKIASATITDTQLASDSVTTAKIVNDAVTTAKILNANVTAAKVAANVIGGDQLIVGAAEGQLLVAGANPYKFAVKAMSGAATMDKDGVVTLASHNECELVERSNNTIAAGASGLATWTIRGSLVNTLPYIEVWKTTAVSFASFNNIGDIALPVGVYMIEATAPAYKAGRHICRLVRYNVSTVVQESYYGTSELASVASGTQTRSFVRGMITVVNSSDVVRLEHYTELIEAVDGMGYPSSSGGTYEVYATIRIRQIS